MYLTEEEARKIHCPLIPEGRELYMETGKPAPASACMGSKACPVWRHSGLTYKGVLVDNAYYCGLGGKP